jgi:hypothetical protein
MQQLPPLPLGQPPSVRVCVCVCVCVRVLRVQIVGAPRDTAVYGLMTDSKDERARCFKLHTHTHTQAHAHTSAHTHTHIHIHTQDEFHTHTEALHRACGCPDQNGGTLCFVKLTTKVTHGHQSSVIVMSWVGQNHIYTVYTRYFWQGNHRLYGHIRCIYTVLANPSDESSRSHSDDRCVYR